MTEDQIVQATTHQVCQLHAQKRRLKRILRAIDLRLHHDTSPESVRQICRIIVQVTAINSEDL